MKKILNQKNILKEAVVLLIAAIMILSTVAVAANTKTANTKTVESYSTIMNDIIFEDDFESYYEFVLDFPPWTQYDGDGGPTYEFTDFTYPETPYTGSYMIFNPDYTEPPVDWYAHSGFQYAACFSSTVLPNDDWMITPQISLTENCLISFWASTIYDGYGYERFKVGVSTTDNDPGSFTIITPGDYVEVNQYPGWFEFAYSLVDYDNTDVYIAIICCSYDAFVLGIDDVVVSEAGPGDLDCEGTLSWTEVEPGSTVQDSFTVENIGDPFSLLNWELDSYPEWGNWTFSEESGSLLHGEVTIDVEVVAPDETETEFTGEVIIVNSDDSEDTCIIDVALATPFVQISSQGTATFHQIKNSQTPSPLTKDRDVILFESFEDTWVADSDGDLAPPGWENHILNTAGTTLPTWWGQVGTVSFTSGDVVPPDGDYQAMVYWDYGDQDEWLITPEITLGDNSELVFEFYGHYGSTNGDHYYVKVSPTGGYEKTDFTDEIWDASTEPEQDNHYDFPVVIDLSNYDGMTIRIAWQDWALGGLWYAHFIDAVSITSGGEPAIPDLDCSGELDFVDVEPNGTVTGTITVENIGEPDSELDWEVLSYPEWGNWSFDPESGTDLAEGASVDITVDIVAPDEPETEFTGEVVLVNSDDSTDTCTILVTLVTPVSQSYPFLEILAQRFPIIAKILALIF